MTLTGAATPIWYVTFEIRKRGILPKQRSPRETRTFVTEDEAKIFARSKLEEGLTLFAGTINPHFPKRLVPSSQIYAWLADEHDEIRAGLPNGQLGIITAIPRQATPIHQDAAVGIQFLFQLLAGRLVGNLLRLPADCTDARPEQ